MTARERFQAVLRFERPAGRMPMIEWAAWWGETTDRWKTEGWPQELSYEESLKYFDLDVMHCIVAGVLDEQCPKPTSHGAGLLEDEAGYAALRPHLLPEASIDSLLERARELKDAHDRGECVIRLWLDGFFWYPRRLFGIEPHLYAFYDQPDLMHRMNPDLAEFHLRVIDRSVPGLLPDFVAFAEDMSYNHGPMLSQELFDEFCGPTTARGARPEARRDPGARRHRRRRHRAWSPGSQEAGIEGIYPLERQAGVDVARDAPAPSRAC